MLRMSPLWSSLGPKMLKYFSAYDALEHALAPRPQIEELLRIAVHVERREAVRLEIFAQIASRANRRSPPTMRRRSARRARAPSARGLREPVVVPDQIRRVAFGRHRARTEMIDLRDRTERVGLLGDARKELLGFKILRKPQRDEVPPLLAATEAVDDERILIPVAIELPQQRAADQACAAGHDVRPGRSPVHATPASTGPRDRHPARRQEQRRCGATRSATENAAPCAAASSPGPTNSANTSPARTRVADARRAR